MRQRPWQIDPGLAADLSAAIGWSVDDGPARLAERIPEVMVCGTTAKLSAMERGEVPPGADVDAITRRVLRAVEDRAEGGTTSSPSWTCWPTATVMAALLDAAGAHVDVVALRRTDCDIVDFHGAVVVRDGHGAWIADPFFGLAMPMPAEGENSAASRAMGEASALAPAGQPWTFEVRAGDWAQACRYVLFAPSLDQGGVRTLCEISTTFSGVSFRRHARLHVDATIVTVREPADEAPNVTAWTRGSDAVHRTITSHASWDEAVADFAGRTGFCIV